MADQGDLQDYHALRSKAQDKGVYEYAKTLKVERMREAGKSRDEISARPQKEDLQRALEERGGCETRTVCDGEDVSSDTDSGNLFGSNWQYL